MSRKLCLPLALLVFSALPSFAQQAAPAGTTACPGGEGYVYLYLSPTDLTVMANLRCGVKVDIIGNVKDYLLVRTADGKQGYVLQSAITPAPAAPTPPPATESSFVGGQKPVRAMAAGPFFGSVAPRAEISAGYSYLNTGFSGTGGVPRQSANGFQSSATMGFTRWLAAEGDFSWEYKGNPLSVATFYDYNAMAGPRVSIRPFFVHALFGLDRLTASLNGSPTFSQNSIAGAIGGGGEWKLTPHWAVYSSADYLLAWHSVPGNTATMQNNIRVSVGMVYRIGGRLAGVQN
jgi:hypothetical protein